MASSVLWATVVVLPDYMAPLSEGAVRGLAGFVACLVVLEKQTALPDGMMSLPGFL